MKTTRAKFKINKGQAAMEYMTMIGISLLILMGLLVVVNVMTTSASNQMNMNTAHDAVNKLAEAADFVYIHGHPTTITIYANIPENVLDGSGNTYIGNRTINLGIGLGSEINDIYSVTKGNIVGELPKAKGYYIFIVKSTGEDVDDPINITYVK